MDLNLGSLQDFLKDIEPLFYGRRLTYVDVGAFEGETFKRFFDSGLRIREALLIEPNPESFAKLQDSLREHPAADKVDLLNLAVGAESCRLRMKASRSMTRVVATIDESEPAQNEPGNDGIFTVDCRPLAALSDHLTERHISILKIDVEGFEKEVLLGCKELLEEQRIDLVYVEAGMNPEGEQQLYYREIDDLMLSHDYRLFRIYEQMFEWMDDSPFLRRANLAYMSQEFAAKHPFRLSNELFSLRKQKDELAAELKDAKASLKATHSELQSTKEELDKAVADRKAEQKTYAAEKEAAAKDKRAELGRKDTALAELDAKLGQARAALEAKVIESESILKEKEAEIESLRREKDEELETLRREMKSRIDGAAADLADVRAALNAKEAEMARVENHLHQKLVRLTKAHEQLEKSYRKMRREFREVRGSWGNRFGRAVIDGTKSPRGMVEMPLKVAKIYTQYLRSRFDKS